MASKDFGLLNMQNDDQEIDLQFIDTDSHTPKYGESSNEQTIYFNEFPDSATDDAEDKPLYNDGESGSDRKASSSSFWTFEYYQQFFDVDSKQVGDRIMWSMIPKPGVNYLQSYIRPNPDLYGPFWIAITLIFTTAITGNLANYFQSSDTHHWQYDFHKITLCTSSIVSYAIIIPFCIWGLVLWRTSQSQLSILELTCLYGYSLAVFVPVSILWLLPIPWLQWCLGIVASVLSGCVLVRNILPALSQEGKKVTIAIACLIIILHAALALGFMLYFFYPPSIKTVQDPRYFSSINAANGVAVQTENADKFVKSQGIANGDGNVPKLETDADKKEPPAVPQPNGGNISKRAEIKSDASTSDKNIAMETKQILKERLKEGAPKKAFAAKEKEVKSGATEKVDAKNILTNKTADQDKKKKDTPLSTDLKKGLTTNLSNVSAGDT